MLLIEVAMLWGFFRLRLQQCSHMIWFWPPLWRGRNYHFSRTRLQAYEIVRSPQRVQSLGRAVEKMVMRQCLAMQVKKSPTCLSLQWRKTLG